MAMINYADKVALNSNSGIADINKCNATDMNEIKSVVNENDTRLTTAEGEIDTGWNLAGETWTYASVDDPTGVIKVNADVTTKYSLGMRIKMTNGGNTIFGILTKIGAYGADEVGYTYLTFLHEIDPTDSQALYLMQDSAITNNYYSNVKVPFGFPLNPDKWAITHQINTTTSLNKTGFSTIDTAILPVGLWKLSCKMMLGQTVTSQVNCYIGWSKSQTSFTNSKYRLFGTVKLSGDNFDILTAPIVMVDVVSKENWYWILQLQWGTPTKMENTATIVPSLYIFECAYL